MPEETETKNSPRTDIWGAVRGSLRIVDKTPPVTPAERQGPLPISSAQRQLWLIEQADPHNVTYNLPFAWRIIGSPNVPALEQSIQALVQRHEMLRTNIVPHGDEPSLVISPDYNVPLEKVSLKFDSVENREAQLQRFLRERASQPFDLRRGSLLRAFLFHLSDAEHVFLLLFHHITTDGSSIAIFTRELTAFYKSFATGAPHGLKPLPVQYADYALWQRRWITDELLKDQVGYWKNKLRGELPIFELPADYPRPAVWSSRGAIYYFRFPPEIAQAVNLFRKKEKITVFNLFLSAFKVMMLRCTGQTDLLVGTPMANRNRSELLPLIGFFPHTLVLRTALTPELTFRQCLERVTKTSLEAYGNQDVSFDRLLEELNPARDLSNPPLFQVMFSFQRMAPRDLELSGLDVQPLLVDIGTSKFDFTLDTKETPQGFLGYIEYSTNLFSRATIERMAGHYLQLLLQAVTNPDMPIGHLPILSDAERRKILVDWNQTDRDFPADDCVTGQFEACVNKTPDEIALVDGKERWTYEQLNARANQVAHRLRSLGVGPDVLVGICLERSANSVVALLACLKAGGAYVPLDPEYPPERLGFMMEDSHARVLITEQRFADRLPLSGQKMVLLDSDTRLIAAESRENLPATAEPENLIYVIYTSGSTGRPKGAGVYRRSFSNLLNWYINELSLSKEDRMLQMISPGFDMAQKNFFAPLLCGAQLHIAEVGPFDSTSIVNQIQQHGITILNCTPSASYPLIDRAQTANFQPLQSLRTVILGGEEIAKSSIRPWLESPNCRAEIINIYGPTECTDISNCYRIPRANLDHYEKIPLGAPIHNVKLAIVDPQMELCPVGVPGELCIGGVSVGAGYINDPARTGERFVNNPFPEIPSPRLYRTGDLVRYLPDGVIDYLRRIDFQIKIRGYRIELGEIESSLRKHPNVREIAVVAQEMDSGQKRLAAFFEARIEPAPDPAELREFVKSSLPAYMAPTLFVAMPVLPITPNGKINRKALSELRPDAPLSQRVVVAPRTDMENALLSIWKEVLGQEQISIHDNFFELGGHSLLATQAVSRIRALLKIEVPLRSLFKHPTVAELSASIANEAQSQEDPIVAIAREGELPISFAQQRLWFLDQLEPGIAAYVIRLGVRMTGALNRDALRKSLSEVVRRHESLRTVYPNKEGRPSQVILEAYPVELPVFDLSNLPSPQKEKEVKAIQFKEASRPFNLQEGPMIRPSLLCLDERHHVLLLNMHHIAFDGWSCSVIFNELSALYEAYLTNSPSPLPELSIQYADFAAWQNRWLTKAVLDKQLTYWKKQLENPPPLSSFPTDSPRPPIQSYLGACQEFLFKASIVDSLKNLCQHEGCTLFMGLLAAFDTLLYRYTGQDDLLVGSPIANRNRTEIEPLIGCFLNTLVLRTDLSGEPTFRQLLARVREVTLEAYANQDLPFEKLVEEIKPVRDQSYSPLFQVLFILQNTPAFRASAADLHLEAFDVENGTTKFDLTLSFNETPGGLRGTAEYACDIFTLDTIQRILASWEQLLLGVLANPDLPISRVPILSEAEKRRIVFDWNQTRQPLPECQSISELIEAQVRATPKAVALIDGEHQWTYAELNAHANQLAHHLRSMGVGPEVLVGLCLERSADMVVAMLAILKAGGAYVPIDSTYPKDRRSYILHDARVEILLTQCSILSSWPELRVKPIKLVCINIDTPAFAEYSAENPSLSNTPSHLAYVLFTSGSTGKPKGVAIEHHSVLALAQWARGVYSDQEMKGVLFATSICFDLSIFELFIPLTCGGKVILAEHALQLPELPAAAQVRLINTVPSAIAGLLQIEGIPPSVQTINLAGEPLSAALVNQLYASPYIQRVYDLYGPTEATTYSTFALRKPRESATIGRPLANEQVYILDKHLKPVPVGVPGELHIGGAGLARGYLNHPELTREKFIPNPFSQENNSRLYKTGDLARFCPDGNIEYLGRLDYQLKIRGFRIELGEIETVLRQHENIKEVVAVAQPRANGEQQIVVYYTSQSQPAPSPDSLKEFTKKTLPDYMLPANFISLEALPLTPNGKVDRKALLEIQPHAENSIPPIENPNTPEEKTLAQIWCEVLNLKNVDMHNNFFELGGHSLLATQVISRMHALGYRNITLKDFFETPTIPALAKRMLQPQKPPLAIIPLSRKR